MGDHLMICNAKKCYLMNITRTRNHLTHNYSLNNHILQTVTREKYLDITISNDLNWSAHINTITNKCNSKLGFLLKSMSPKTKGNSLHITGQTYP